MNEYLLSHTTFALWALYFLLGGAVLCVAWGFNFRRLAHTVIDASDLVWEAWRGLAAGIIWLVMLVMVFSLMYNSSEMNASLAIAASDLVPDALLQAVAHERDIVVEPFAGTLGGAVLVILLTGIWSGAWRVLRGGTTHSATAVHHA